MKVWLPRETSNVLATVNLQITPVDAVITITRGDQVLDEESWRFERRVGQAEADEFAKAVFDVAYDCLNYMTHGDDRR